MASFNTFFARVANLPDQYRFGCNNGKPVMRDFIDEDLRSLLTDCGVKMETIQGVLAHSGSGLVWLRRPKEVEWLLQKCRDRLTRGPCTSFRGDRITMVLDSSFAGVHVEQIGAREWAVALQEAGRSPEYWDAFVKAIPSQLSALQEALQDMEKENAPCVMRPPTRNDVVRVRSCEAIAFCDGERLDERPTWRLQPGEHAIVADVHDDGAFKLRSPAGLVSGWQCAEH